MYAAIDLKSFYASVECIERGLDPLTSHLVVADASRTEKTICLAVSPSLKELHIPGRVRLFEVVSKVREENAIRSSKLHGKAFHGTSYDDTKLKQDPFLSIDYIVATPQMAKYMDYSTKIYQIYLKYVAPEDIHVYSIDEVFLDITHYLKTAKQEPREFVATIIADIFKTMKITATGGIGTNLYLAKVAMDIVAKHISPDENQVRIAQLDEMSYRQLLWTHTPLTDFWRIGRGYAKKLQEHGMFTMGDIAKCSIGTERDFYNEDLLYKLFGINAELLIDHAWGYEPCRMEDIKAFRPKKNSIGSGQVLLSPYTFEDAKIIVREMTELLVLDLVEKNLVTNQVVLTVGYDIDNLKDPKISKEYKGPISTDYYGRKKPKHAHGTAHLKTKTSSGTQITNAVMELYERVVDKHLWIRRVYITAVHVENEAHVGNEVSFEQMDLFTDYESKKKEQEEEQADLLREKKMQQAMIDIKKKYGKNAILKGTNLQKGAMTKERNNQIGGHKA